MKLTPPKRGPYVGRLTFDPATEFHTDPDGRRLVTLDDGKTWRYAKRGDASHNARYQHRVLVVDGTANSPNPEPHHFNVQPDDLHHDDANPGTAKPIFSPDETAKTETSHTEAYA